MKKILMALALCAFAATATSTAYAHSGGTDKNGCHHDRKNGGKHCH